MQKEILKVADGHAIYQTKEETPMGEVPFRVSPVPFKLNQQQADELKSIGFTVTSYMRAAIKLYQNSAEARSLVSNVFPKEWEKNQASYLFVRPDLILTKQGFSLCEIETSPFGLGLSDILTKAYSNQGFELMTSPTSLSAHLSKNLPEKGVVVYTDETSRFGGQMDYLASKVLSQNGHQWVAKNLSKEAVKAENLYRAFYPSEAITHSGVQATLASGAKMVPSLTPHFEAKALLALLWDKRFQQYFQREMGKEAFDQMQRITPLTWVIGQEKWCMKDVKSLQELVSADKKDRSAVIKPSIGSWTNAVAFFDKMGVEKRKDYSNDVLKSEAPFIGQIFSKPAKVPMQWMENGEIKQAENFRVRVTPYYALGKNNEGELLTVKATGCQGTNKIHAGKSSVNTAVSVEKQ